MSTEAMKLALEALEETYAMTSHAEILKHKAMIALREALAQPQQEPVAWMHEWEDGEKIPMLKGRDDRNQDKPKTVRPLVYGDTSPQPAQPQQELEYCTDYHCAGDCGQPHNQEEMREFLASQPQQEPVAWMSDHAVGFKKSEFGATPTVPLYTSPPARKPLTDEEIEKLNCVVLNQSDWNEFEVFQPSVIEFARAIEAAHGIKE